MWIIQITDNGLTLHCLKSNIWLQNADLHADFWKEHNFVLITSVSLLQNGDSRNYILAPLVSDHPKRQDW